MLLKVKKSE